MFQQSLLIISNLINNQNSKDFKIGFFIDQNVVNIQKFNTDLLKMNSSSEILFISNLKNFGNGYKDLPYFVTPSTDFLEATLKHYDSLLKSGYTFDIFIPDISLVDVWYDDAFIKMLPYTNKIYMLSDGNYQTFRLAENFVKSMKQYENVAIENFNNVIIENLKKMLDINVPVQEKKELNQKYNFFTYLRTNFIDIFHIEKYVDSPYYEISSEIMYPTYLINYDYLDLSYKLNDSIQSDFVNKYIKFYESFFKIENNDLSTFVTKGFENYDPNKKNIIWMGDSLIRSHAQITKAKKDEIQKTFQALTWKYSPNEYNFFFKHHPFYSEKEQIELTNFISGLVPNFKPIYFANFPWELFLSWDKSENRNNPFFSEKTNSDLIPKTTLVGIQYTTTTVLATYSFLIQQYSISKDDAWKSVNYQNFPVPGTFDILNTNDYGNDNFDKQVTINKEKTYNVYAPYIANDFLSNYYKDQNTTKEFILNHTPPEELEKTNQDKISKTISIVSLTVVFTSAVVIITTIIVVRKRKLI